MTQAPTQSSGFDLGGGGGASFSFGPQGSQPGASITGTVLDMKEVQRTNFDTKKPEFWDNGDPKMQYRVTMQTDQRDPGNPADDGKRDLYLDGRRRPNDNGTKSRLCAVLDAVREATGGTELQRGGKLTVQWVSGMGFSGDPRNYQATYQAPALNLGGQATQQQPVPASDQFNSPGPAPQWAQTEQGPVNTATGEVQQGPVNTATGEVQQGQQQTPQQASPAASGPTPEAIAALRAAGVDPATVYPGFTG